MNFSNLTSQSDTTILGIGYVVIGVLSILANGAIILVILKTDCLHMPAIWIQMLRATVDFITGLNILAFYAPSAFLNRFAYGKNLMGFASFVGLFLNGQNVANLVLMLVDRFISIRKPMKYNKIVTTRRVFASFIISILINFIRIIFTFFPADDFIYMSEFAFSVHKNLTKVKVFGFLSFPLLGLAAIIVTACLIAREIKRKKSRVDSSENNASFGKFTLMTLLSVGVFSATYVPCGVVVIWIMTFGKENLNKLMMFFAVMTFMSSGLWNILIYTATYHPFRQAFLQVFFKNYFRNKKRKEILQIIAET